MVVIDQLQGGRVNDLGQPGDDLLVGRCTGRALRAVPWTARVWRTELGFLADAVGIAAVITN